MKARRLIDRLTARTHRLHRPWGMADGAGTVPVRAEAASAKPLPPQAGARGPAVALTLKVIPKPEPNTRTILMKASAPVLAGKGTITYLCGACGVVLVMHTPRLQLYDVVIRCPDCGSFNEVP